MSAILLLFTINVFAQLHITPALCENKINPLGVNIQDIRFSWEMDAKENTQYQTAYQLVIATSEDKLTLGNFDVYNSSVVKNNQSVLVKYKGKRLMPGQSYYWKLRVWDKNNKPSKWSDNQQFITGLFGKNDWMNAEWIGYEELPDSMRVAPGVHAPFANEVGNKAMRRPVVPLFRKI